MGCPLREVAGGVAGRVQQRADLEGRLPNRVFRETARHTAAVERRGRAADKDDRQHGDQGGDGSGVDAELNVVPEHAPLAVQDLPKQREVDAGDDHERDDHPLDDRAERRDAVGFRREAAGRQRRKPVGDGVIQVHLGCQPAEVEPVEDDHQQQREPEVEQPQGASGFGDPRRELLEIRPRCLGFHQLRAVDRELRQNSDHQHDDPHPAEPLGELSPQHDRMRVAVDADFTENGRPGRRKAAHRLEDRVDDRAGERAQR